MPKDTKTLGNSKARACESLGFVHKKGCARVLTHLLTKNNIPSIPNTLYYIYLLYSYPGFCSNTAPLLASISL